MGKRFGGVGGAKLNRRGVFFEAGDYEVEIKRCEYFTSREKEEFFIAECRVLASTNEKHPIGSERNWMPKMNQDMSEVNLKGFSVAALGIEDTDAETIAKVTDDEFAELLESALDGPDKENTNALAGTKLHLTVIDTTLKDGKTPFAVHKWSPSRAPKAAPAAAK